MGDAARKAELFEQLARGQGDGQRQTPGAAGSAGAGPARLPTSPPLPGWATSTSAHLQTLKQAGLVATARDGTTIRYRLADTSDVAALYRQLRDVAARLPDRRGRPAQLPRHPGL